MTRWIALIALGAVRLAAQQPTVTTIKSANGALSEGFRAMPLNETLEAPRGLHELSDGRVLVTDGRRTVLADFETGSVQVMPELRAGDLLALPGDSSIITRSDGWYFLDGLRSIGMLPSTNPVVRLASSNPTIDGADDKRHILVELPRTRAGDSITAVLVDRATGDRQVVAKLWPGNAVQPGTFRPVCQMFERAVLTGDGWVAVLRANPYRVDWRSPSGQWTLGAPIRVPLIPMTQHEREVYLEWRARELPQLPRDTVRSWPATVCPWVGGYGPRATPDGKLVVYRVPTSEAPATRYDVLDRHGRVERQIAMPASDAILGFGRNSVFVVRTEGAKQFLRRHPWP